jgi:hypothetical protein
MGPLPKWKGNAKIISLLAILWATEMALWRFPLAATMIYWYWSPISSSSPVDHVAAIMIIISNVLVAWYTICSIIEAQRVTRAALRDLPA